MSDPTEVTIRGPIDLIAMVPHLLGYQPDDGDVLILGLRDRTVVMAACTNFGDVPIGHERDAVVDALAGPLSHTPIDAAVIVGYGAHDGIGAVIDSLCDFLATRGTSIVDTLRVSGQRYYPHTPAGGARVPTGAPFDTATTTLAATMIVSGSVAQPNRAALADQFRPVTGTERANMHAATVRARHRLQHITAAAADPATVIEQAGRDAAAIVYERHHSGDRPTDDEAAWLTLLLTDTAVRDDAWRHTHGHHGHLTLWTDLTRRAEPDLAAAPASLLALTAWRMGNGVIANIAVQRALDADPTYRMAHLLQTALTFGIPPTAIGTHLQPVDDPLAPKGSAAG